MKKSILLLSVTFLLIGIINAQDAWVENIEMDELIFPSETDFPVAKEMTMEDCQAAIYVHNRTDDTMTAQYQSQTPNSPSVNPTYIAYQRNWLSNLKFNIEPKATYAMYISNVNCKEVFVSGGQFTLNICIGDNCTPKDGLKMTWTNPGGQSVSWGDIGITSEDMSAGNGYFEVYCDKKSNFKYQITGDISYFYQADNNVIVTVEDIWHASSAGSTNWFIHDLPVTAKKTDQIWNPTSPD